MDRLIALATAVEGAALAHPKISNTEGGVASFTRAAFAIVASNGFSGQILKSSHSFYTSVIASSDNGMETDYAQSSAIWHADLDDPETIGKLAALRTASKLDSIKIDTARLPVIFDPRVSGSLLSAFAGAIGGKAVFKNMTFLRDKMGQRVFPAGINIVDDPTIPRGLGSGAFDVEGVARRKLLLVEDGILKTWTMGIESARKLKARSTGHASGNGNLSMAPGNLSPAELIGDIREGLYVTSFMGGGGNTLTGDYSRGAEGFLIRDGKITDQAVSEVTLGGTLGDIFANLTPANDFDPRDFLRKGKTIAPTIRIEGLTIGGK